LQEADLIELVRQAIVTGLLAMAPRSWSASSWPR